MGCVVAKPSMNSPPRGLEKLKLENDMLKEEDLLEQGGQQAKGHVRARNPVKHFGPNPQRIVALVGDDKTFRSEPTKNSSTGSYGSGGSREGKSVGGGGGTSGSDAENFARRFSTSKSSGEDELVDGWPKWLTDNIPRDALAGLVPKSAESYEKLDKIGQGTYSNVYKARDRDTGKLVALKKVHFDTSEPENVKFMAREIRILRKLDHPNVVKLEGLAASRM